MHKLKYRVCT